MVNGFEPIRARVVSCLYFIKGDSRRIQGRFPAVLGVNGWKIEPRFKGAIHQKRDLSNKIVILNILGRGKGI